MRLEEMLDKLDVAKVTIRGKVLTVRPISAHDMNAIDAQAPAPLCRFQKPHPGGVRHGMVPDEDHPEYKRLREPMDHRRYALMVACGLGVEGPGGKWRADMSEAEAQTLANHVLQFFKWAELNAIVSAQSGIVMPPASTDDTRIGTGDSAGN